MTSSNGGIKQQAQHGFAKASAYEAHRPSYPPQSVQLLLEQLGIANQRESKIVDLAAGTGKFTEILAAREEEYRIVAVEPHDGMRDVLAAKHLPNVTVQAGRANATDLPDESVDAVIIAQAFHWFANDETLRELHRILKPHGALGLIWNIEDYNAPRNDKATTPWEGKLHDVVWSFDDDQPRFRHEKWRAIFDDQIKGTPLSMMKPPDPLFSLPLGEHREEWEVLLSQDRVWDRFSTLSQIATLEGDELKRTHSTFLEALNGSEVERNTKGEVALHGTTYAVWTTKIPADGRDSLTGVERPSS